MKKLYSLEASNIDAVSKNAKIKIAKVRAFLDVLYKRLSRAEKYLIELEKRKNQKDDTLKNEVEKERFNHRLKEIKFAMSKKDNVKALSLSKKLVYDFQ